MSKTAYDYIGFCRRSGTPFLHGETEAATWQHLIDLRLGAMGRRMTPRLIEAYIETFKPIIKIVYCGDGGPRVWERKTTLRFAEEAAAALSPGVAYIKSNRVKVQEAAGPPNAEARP